MSPQKSGKYVFRKNDSVGALDAESDGKFLETCFVDIGDLETLSDINDAHCVILGRTGSGKTALLLELEKQCVLADDMIIRIKPESLSFNYISNSQIIRDLESVGVNLEAFFKLLWKHVFAVSIFKERFSLVDETTQSNWLTQLFEKKSVKQQRRQEDENRKRAVEYVKRWGSQFWETTEVRVKEIVTHFEEEVSSGISAKLGGNVGIGAGKFNAKADLSSSSNSGARDLTGTTVTADVVASAKRVVNDIQMRELAGILELVEQILMDGGRKCYIVIDRLDEDWVSEELRIRLMKALLDVVKEFVNLKNVKIVICLRVDLLEQMFRELQGSRMQADKYRDIRVTLEWTDAQLEEVLNERVKALIKDQYTNYQPTVRDILPSKMGAVLGGIDGLAYVISRSWRRPRDVIAFLNIAIHHSKGKPRIERKTLLQAEGEYSSSRLTAIAEEWAFIYPRIDLFAKAILERQKSFFRAEEITEEALSKCIDKCMSEESLAGSIWYQWAGQALSQSTYDEFRRQIVCALYEAGIVGLKIGADQPIQWASNNPIAVSLAEVDPMTRVEVHPGLWRVFGIIT